VFVDDSSGDKNGSTNATSGADQNFTINNLSAGFHTWNVSCTDDLGNSADSVFRNFTINQPDLATSNGNLTFNDSNPNPGQNVTIFLNVTNIGGNPATNAAVEFWDGPRISGTLLRNATVTVAVNATLLVNTSFVISQGYHVINVYVDPSELIAELNESNNNATRNLSTLISNITLPANNTFTTDTTPQINFTMFDFSNTSIINYTIYVDGSPNGQNGSNIDGNFTVLDISVLAEGVRTIVVEATDPLGRRKNSTPLVITIDQTAPVSTFETLNNTFFNTSTPNIFFNITDNVDSVLNWTIYVDGSPNRTGIATNAITTNTTIGPLTNGSYILTLEAFDDTGNIANSTNITIFVDQIPPNITLNTPDNNSNFTTTSVDLNYTVIDSLDNTLVCELFLDGSQIDNRTANNNTPQVITASGLSEASHLWNVTCVDSALNRDNSEIRTINVFIAPNITLNAPANNSITSNTSLIFFFNVTDDTGIENCSLLLNGLINLTKSGVNITNNVENNFTQTFDISKRFNWSVTCFDNTSLNVQATSNLRNLTVDLDNPVPRIETTNQTSFNTSTPSIDFNITDNFDSLINFTFYVDGSFNVNGSVTNGTSSSQSLAALSDGPHVVVLQGTDNAGNAANSTPINITVDTVAPNTTLLYPGNNTNYTVTILELNFTVIDALDPVLVCNLTLDDSIIRSNFNANNNTVVNTTTSGLSSGNHFWNVTCVDNAGNVNNSLTFQFLIESPDLNVSDIIFNSSQPIEGENITIDANVSNIGNLIANNITVQFYSGDPDFGGVQINGNLTIPTLGLGNWTIVSVNYTTVIGVNTIFVLVDPPLATNGSITESNENNNERNESIQVGLYHIIAGDATDRLRITDTDLILLFNWNVSNKTGSNVLVTDTDSSISIIHSFFKVIFVSKITYFIYYF